MQISTKDDTVYISRHPGTHSAGDQRLYYKGLAGPLSVSMVGRLLGDTITEYIIPGEGLLDQEQSVGGIRSGPEEEKLEELEVDLTSRVSLCSRQERPRQSIS